jgi:imidazole glycerol-phosphate synthase subunit HisH
MSLSVAIIDYGSGNLRSAAKAFERAAREAGLDAEILVTSDTGDVLAATHIVLPGVGAYGDCVQGLHACDGMVAALNRAAMQDGKPFLGICVGMQLMASVGREFGSHEGLGWIEGDVVALQPDDASLKIPHMGWNDLIIKGGRDHPVLTGLKTGAHAYFVHSFHFCPESPSHVLAEADYGGPVAAIVGRDNIIGTQFHPEKSQATGLMLITNFLNWTPAP